MIKNLSQNTAADIGDTVASGIAYRELAYSQDMTPLRDTVSNNQPNLLQGLDATELNQSLKRIEAAV